MPARAQFVYDQTGAPLVEFLANTSLAGGFLCRFFVMLLHFVSAYRMAKSLVTFRIVDVCLVAFACICLPRVHEY